MRSTLQTLAILTALITVSGCGSKAAPDTAANPAPAAGESPPDVGAGDAAAPAPGGSPFGGAGEDLRTRAEERLPAGISAAAAKLYLEKHPETLVLDVRDPREWDDDLGHIEGSRLIPLAELPQRGGEIREWLGKPVIVVCRVGARSDMAASMLRRAGYTNVANLEGGLEAWRRAGY